jgi:hypothetical protein
MDNTAPFWRRFVWRSFAISAVMLVIFFANDFTVSTWSAMGYPFLFAFIGLTPTTLEVWRLRARPKSRIHTTLAILIASLVAITALFTGKFLVVYQALVAISLPFGVAFSGLGLFAAWKEHTQRIQLLSSQTHTFQVRHLKE